VLPMTKERRLSLVVIMAPPYAFAAA